ncbi:NLI interacting factor-like phosphatase family protein [Aphelenchoides avenae]|nr:NLI interacting factor-like phosphatase family protein [Aphelenchus avenae]
MMNGTKKRTGVRNTDNLAVRCAKSAIYTVLLWIYSVYNCIMFFWRKQYRAIRKHQVVKYEMVPLSPLTAQRLSVVRRKILVLDLDETLIHSHHDGVLRPTVKPTTPPDFVLKVTIDRQPVRFFVHLRPHVDYFLSVVSTWYVYRSSAAELILRFWV